MLILGVDPSSTSTGFAIIEASRYKAAYITCGCIRPKGSFEDRLVGMYDALEKIILSFKPESGAIEDTFFGKNARSAAKLNQARGGLIIAMCKAGLDIESYTPTQVKKAATGSGKSTKEQVQFMVAKTLGLKEMPKPLDASDALAIALCRARR